MNNLLSAHFLVSMKLMSGRDPERLRELFRQITEVEWIGVSSVYRVQRSAQSLQGLRYIRGEEVLDGFSCVARGQSDLGPEKLLTQLQSLERSLSDQKLKRTLSVNCLVYGSRVIRTPSLTLPHPEFHLNPEELIPSAELWPEYEHPILLKTLSQLANDFHGVGWGEYYCSGRDYL